VSVAGEAMGCIAMVVVFMIQRKEGVMTTVCQQQIRKYENK
jgi:hypothetical protein